MLPSLLLLSLFLAGCSNCSAPEPAVTPTRTAAAQLQYRPFAAVISTTSAMPERETLKSCSVQLAAELAKVGTLPEDALPLAPDIRTAFPEGNSWLSGLEYRDGQALEHAIKPILEQRPYVAITPADVEWLKQEFAPDALDKRMVAIAETLDALPSDSVERRRLQHDPLNVLEHARETLRERLHAQASAFAVGPDGFFIAPDDRTALVLGWAATPREHAEFPAVFLAACDRAKERALTAMRAREKAGGDVSGIAIQFVTPGAAGTEPAREHASAAFQRSVVPLRVVFEAADEAHAIAAAAQVRARLKEFVERGDLAPLNSVLDLIRSEAAQRENFAALRSFDFEAALKAFQAAASKRFGTRGLIFFKPFLQRLEKFGLLTREPQTLSLRDALNGRFRAELAPYLQINADGSMRWSLWYFPKPAGRTALTAELEKTLAAQTWAKGVTVRVLAEP